MIELNAKYGCLTVLDMGEEYEQLYESERDGLLSEIRKCEYILEHGTADEKKAIVEQALSDKRKYSVEHGVIVYWNWGSVNGKCARIVEELRNKLSRLEARSHVHYKCQCKCGKVHYYDEKTLEKKPRFCFYPIFISTRHTYSIKAQNATYNKKKKYEGIECIVLCDREDCVAKPGYCGLYNKQQERKYKQRAQKLEEWRKEREAERASYPRRYNEHYDNPDLTGTIHETLDILEPVEDVAVLHEFFCSQSYYEIFRQYKCRCQLCGKEYVFRSDDFVVNPPTDYGPRAYDGYWSDAHCDCHPVSSFQWTVVKFLEENDFRYYAEVGFPGLFGVNGGALRFDFVILDAFNMVKCLIECQGEQHYKPVEEFGGESKFRIQQANDELKREFVEKHNIPFIELSYKSGKTVGDRLRFLDKRLHELLSDDVLEAVKLYNMRTSSVAKTDASSSA